jgi:NAD(P)-dependent dehydrogenase (short-subunit alcohol dehydrogenase family)
MSDNKVWLITGAARGMGIDIVKAALAAGHSVVATARDAGRVTEVFGEQKNLLALALDITDENAARAAVEAAVARFGRIDVLVNNAGLFYAGFFEEISSAQFRHQMEVNFFGPLNVTRAVLPVMREQRSGQVVTLSSTAGLVGQEFVAAYCASKFALEGWMESIRYDLAPYGITTTIVEPGFFRTELLVEGSSTLWPELSLSDYAERTAATIEGWKSMNGKQSGDPAKLASALVTVVDRDEPPLRWLAGADAVATAEQKADDLRSQAEAFRQLSSSLNHDDAAATTT